MRLINAFAKISPDLPDLPHQRLIAVDAGVVDLLEIPDDALHRVQQVSCVMCSILGRATMFLHLRVFFQCSHTRRRFARAIVIQELLTLRQ